MIEEILTNLYKIEIPLPGSPLKALNSYVIKGPERSLIIDTGWDRKECMNAMQTGLRELKVDLGKSDFFITHFHPDHLSLVFNLAAETSKIYFNQPEANFVGDRNRWDRLFSYARKSGLPESDIQAVIHSHPGYKYRPKTQLTFTILKENDDIAIGGYLFRCVETPGHTWGHLCLYEPNKKVLVSGDHILNDITPNIQLWSDEWDPLAAYFRSLDRVYGLDIGLVLPGHRNIFTSCKERIEELRKHHQRRLDEVSLILEEGAKDAHQVASQMKWDISYDYDSFELFPVLQKWFATGEAIAHLKYLEESGMIRRQMQENKILYSLSLESQT